MRVIRAILFVFGFATMGVFSACGVKGAPTPYVEAYPEKPKEVAQVPAQPEAPPTPSPSPVIKIKKSTPKKKKQE